MARYRTYTLRIEQTEGALALGTYDDEELQSAIQAAEDVVNRTLPDGYYCKIDDAPAGVDMQAVERLERYARGE